MRLFLFSLLLILSALFPRHSFSQPCREVVGYYPGWQWYDRGQLVQPATIEYDNYTILNYAFFKPLPNGDIVGGDAWADENLLLGQINWSTNPVSYYPNTSLVDLAHNHNVKVLISVGGWTWSNDFPAIAADPVKRSHFAQSCRELVQQYNLDGIDIDWEYPGYAEHNGTPADKQNFTLLMHQVRDSLTAYGNSTGETYLLTSCFGASPSHMSHIECDDVVPLVDLVNLMSYDFFGTWDAITNHNAPLTVPAQGDPTFNITSAVQTLRNTYGVPAIKINIGAAFYGRSAKTTGSPGLHVPQTGNADTQTFSADDGSPMYYNILDKANLFTDHWDPLAQVPYMTGNGNLNTFLSYDNPASIAAKAQYAVAQNLRGVIIWEITGDYLETAPGSGIIAGTPLADTIRAVFCGNVPPPNAAPSVSIAAPVDNTVFVAPATVNISVNASDSDGTVSKVEFYRGNTLIGTDFTAPYTFSWTNVAAGTYTLTAKAYDNLNAVTTSAPVPITVNASNTPPIVAITQPLTGTSFYSPATVNITATASDADGTITKVRFYQGSTLLGEDTSAPYTWTIANLANGNYTLKAKAWDNNNAATTSAGVVITVVAPGTNLPPVTQITSPLQGATFTAPASFVIAATASDPNGTVTKVRFYNGNTLLGQDLTAPYTWSISNLAAGTYSLRSRAYDNNGASAWSPIVTITVVNNSPPTVSLTTPANDATFTAPAGITLSANASDVNGAVTLVRFFNGNTLLGEDATAPYAYYWANAPAGSYVLTAQAQDNHGATSTSAAVHITVNSAPQSNCSAPTTFYFDPAAYIPLGEIQLGQGRLHPIWGVSVDAFIPSNRLNWAISMVHAAHLFRNVAGTDHIPVNFYFATAAKESFCGCDPNILAAPAGTPFPFTYQPASLGDGCFQIEGNSAYNELIQQYPQRFPAGQHPQLIGNHHYETAALSKAYYDIFTVKYWEVHHGWNPVDFFNNAADPDATIRLMAVAYNRGLWYPALGTVLNTDRENALASTNLAPYFLDNAYGYDYQNALTSYCLTLGNQAGLLDPSQTAINPTTGQPFNAFDSYYDPLVSWADVNAYIDSIAVLYPEVNIAAVKSACQSTFNTINNGNSVSFRYQLGQVINTLLLNLPADDPSSNISTIYGCSEGNNQTQTCTTPGGLSAANITENGAWLSWSNSGAVSYNLQYRAATTTVWTTLSVNTYSYNLSGLSACTTWEFRVQGICNSGTSAWSGIQGFNTAGCSGVSCSVPAGLSAVSSDNGATLNWTATGAASYHVQYKPAAAPTWNHATVNTNQFDLIGLMPCTGYVFRVQSVCSGIPGEWSAEAAFATTGCSTGGPAPTNYCSSYSLNATAEWIQSFAFGSIDNDSGNNSGFGNFVNISTNLVAGSILPMTISAGFAGMAYPEFINVWLDFNRDGDFADAGENAVHTTLSNTMPLTVNVAIPAGVSIGGARLRVQLKRSSYGTACDIYSHGEVEDYAVEFVPGGMALNHFAGLPALLPVADWQVHAWPNPFGDYLRVALSFPAEAETTTEIGLYNALGERVCHDIFALSEGLIPTDGLPAGFYWLVAVRGAERQLVKVVKE